MQYLSVTEVQHFLDCLAPMQEFAVVFTKKDGSQRVIVGYLHPANPEKRMDNVPVVTDEGVKSFNRGRVLWAGWPDDIQGVINLMAGYKEIA